MELSKKRILVTGAAGFIGSFLSERLLEQGCHVCGIDSLNDYYSTKLKLHRLDSVQKYENFTFHQFSLIDVDKLKQITDDFKPEIVINLAAQAGVRYSLKNPMSYLDSNLISYFNLLECIKNQSIEKFIFASSSSVYGLNSAIPFKEDSFCNQPVSLYAATKQSNEALAYSFTVNTGIPSIALRFFTVYGPKGRPDMAYYKFSDMMQKRREITIFNEGKMSRDMTYIDDIVDGIIKSIQFNDFQQEPKFETFNLGNNHPISIWDLVSYIEDYLGYKATYRFESSSLEVKETWADLTKSRDLLAYKPKIKFQHGMKNFLDWFVQYNA